MLTSAPKEKTSKASGKSTEGSKSHHKSDGESTQADEPINTAKDLKEPAHQEFETGVTEDQPDEETYRQPAWFQKPTRPPTPDRQQYPHDLRKLLPLIPNPRGRQVIPFDHFINNDLVYLSGGDSSRRYINSVTKTKAADYWHTKWIKDLVPNIMWSQVPVDFDKHALWGLGAKMTQFYAFAVNKESARDVYSKRRIIDVTKLEIVEWQNYKHLD
ncbi:hypothetical protein Tco_1230771 [Tanacetum coccineum]